MVAYLALCSPAKAVSGQLDLRMPASMQETFAVLSGTSGALEKSSLFGGVAEAGDSTMKGMVRKVGFSAVAGLPAGFVNAQALSLMYKGRFSGWSNAGDSALNFAVLGGVLGGAQDGLSTLRTAPVADGDAARTGQATIGDHATRAASEQGHVIGRNRISQGR